MKQLSKMNAPGKAILLYQLFADEIPGFLSMLRGMCQFIRRNKDSNIEWNEQLCTYDEWIALANNIEQRLKKYQPLMANHATLFAEHLFDDKLAIFTAYYLLVHANFSLRKQSKFKQAITLFFF